MAFELRIHVVEEAFRPWHPLKNCRGYSKHYQGKNVQP